MARNALLKLTAAGAATWVVRRVLRSKRRISFRSRVVVITGGRGLALVLARQLAEEGARLALIARDPDELDRARHDLTYNYGAEVLTVACDVTDRVAVDHTIRQIFDHYGRLDVLVNNAGVIQVGPIEHMERADFEEAMDVHVWGALNTITAAVPLMRQRGFGRIVNISSIGGEVSVPHLIPYCTSKFALVGLSEGLRTELARYNILVTTVCPGLMRTGSPRHAFFKGQHDAEFTSFAISDSLPLITVDARRAARQIIQACRYGDARITISLIAKLAVGAHALFPGVVADVFAMVNSVLLPKPVGPQGHIRKPGSECGSVLAPSILTRLSDQAAQRNNETNGNGHV